MKAYKDDSTITRLAVLETIVDQTSQTLMRLEKKMDEGFGKFENKFDKIDSKFSELRKELHDIRKENTSHFRTTIFAILTLIGAPLLVQSIQLLNKLIS